jgi:hypothetical protein
MSATDPPHKAPGWIQGQRTLGTLNETILNS